MMPYLILFVLLVSCSANEVRKFSDLPILEKDSEDFRAFSPRPEEYKAATIWDGVDETLLRPLPQLFAFEASHRAKNVNALDEIPDSTWWTSRSKTAELSLENVKRGACEKPIDPEGPFEVLSGKPDGWNPGFLVKAPDGRKYFFKFDQHELQPERMSSAEVIGALIYHSIGYTVPCNEVLYFDRSHLKLSKTATMKNNKGEKVPMTEEFVDDAFKLVKMGKGGKVRAISSLLLEGSPIGPWSYEGTKSDDPNDVIPHQDRREVRAGYVLASWLNHFDTRDQNTLSTWIESKDRQSGYVRHNILDFGDSIGNISDDDVISKRLGFSYYFDFPYFVEDFFTLGFVVRPWDKAQYGPAGANLGYFNVEQFDPDAWRPGYPNPGFKRMQESDASWMARLIARFRDTHLEAIVEKARISNPILKTEILMTLKGRRDKLLRRWFKNISPLSEPEFRQLQGRQNFCLRDLALFSKLFSPPDRSYKVRSEGKAINVEKLESESKLCFPLSELPDALYQVVSFESAAPHSQNEGLLRAHLQKKNGVWAILGIERP